MGGAVLYSRQSNDCPDYPDCTCEDYGMMCDLETYDWYDCSDETIAGPNGYVALEHLHTQSMIYATNLRFSDFASADFGISAAVLLQLPQVAPLPQLQQEFLLPQSLLQPQRRHQRQFHPPRDSNHLLPALEELLFSRVIVQITASMKMLLIAQLLRRPHHSLAV